MWLKVIIVILFIAILISLSSGLVFLLKDMGVPGSKRTLYALGVRITLAALLIASIWYGYDAGILTNTAPWGR
ncbi:DUF2909 domain-containing protein [Aurantivibrio plasticivorans]